MAKSTKNTLLILGGFVFGVLLGCAGLSALAMWGLSAFFGEGDPEVTTVGTIDCPTGPVTVVNHHRVTNWLAGVSRDDAFLVVDDAEVPILRGRLRTWLPARHLPSHRVDGDASVDGFEIFFDPDEVSASSAARTEACLIGRREEVLGVIHRTGAHSWVPDEPEGIIYWRASEEDVTPVFEHASGQRLTIVNDGYIGRDTETVSSTVGHVTLNEDGTFRVRVHPDLWAPSVVPVEDFVDADGRSLSVYYGAPIEVNPEGPL